MVFYYIYNQKPRLKMNKSTKLFFVLLILLISILNNVFAVNENYILTLKSKWKLNPDLVLTTCDSMLNNNKNLSNSEKFEIFKLQANIYLDKYALKLSYENFDKALNLLPEIDSTDLSKSKLKADILNNIGNIMAYQGLYSISLANYNEALEIYTQLNNTKGQAVCINNLGYVYETQKLYQKALKAYQKAYTINSSFNNLAGQAMNLANIGAIYDAQKKYDSALLFNQKSLEIRLLLKDSLGIVACYSAMGQIYLNKGELKKAFTFFKSSLNASTEKKADYPLAVIYKNIGDYYTKINNLDSSIYYFSKSLFIAQNIKSYSLILDNAEILSQWYAKKGLFDKAYTTELIAKMANDTLSQQSTLQEITKLELKHSFDTKQKEFEFSQKKKELNFLILIIILFAIILISILLVIRQRLTIYNKNLEEDNLMLEKKILQEKLEDKNKQLTTNSLYLSKKNELLSSLEKQLINVNKHITNEPESKFRIHEMINTVKRNTDEDTWKDFEVRFSEVHTNFYENLLKKHPKLSLNEKRLSAFLRLNMTTKEISLLTQQTPHSINIARFRLRKKLGLNSDESLETFLMNF